MTSYYPPPQQQPPYPTQDPVFVPSQSYHPTYAPQYPQSYPQQQQQQPQQTYYPPQPSQQQQPPPPPWNPEQIYAEANGLPQHHRSFTSRAQASPQPFANPPTGGERGIGTTLLGGGAGAFLGHEMGHGKMATLGGLAVGAIAANVLEHHHEKKKLERDEERAYEAGEARGFGDGEEEGEGYYDDRSSSRDYEFEEPRQHPGYYDRRWRDDGGYEGDDEEYDRESCYQEEEEEYRGDRY